jgi:hypothetical protein
MIVRGTAMQRKEPFFRPASDPAAKLREYRETVARLRSLTDELERGPLHPVATEAIRHCLTLIERCWTAPDGGDKAPQPQRRVAAIAERLTALVNDRHCA